MYLHGSEDSQALRNIGLAVGLLTGVMLSLVGLALLIS
jgi:hypothetical protein